MCQLKQGFKELKQLGELFCKSCLDSIFPLLFSVLFLHIPMLMLNAIVTSYLVWGISCFVLVVLKIKRIKRKMAGASAGNQNGIRVLSVRTKFTR